MIKQQLQTDQIAAMKSKDSQRLDTLRYILAQIKNEEIDTQKEPDDAVIVSILRKETKKLKDAIESFEKAARTDLAQEYLSQLNIIQTYLPAEITDDQLRSEITKILESHKEVAAAKPQMLIGICVSQLKSKADPTRIATLVRSMQA